MTHKENDEMLSAVQVLVQHLCTKCPERAEYRNIVAKVRECFKWDEFIGKVFLWFDSNIVPQFVSARVWFSVLAKQKLILL